MKINKKLFLFVTALYFFLATHLFSQVETEWVRRFNGLGNSDDRANAIVIDKTGNICVTGYSNREYTPPNYDVVTIKYNADGDTQWLRMYNGIQNQSDYATEIAIDSANNIIVAGYLYMPVGGYDYLINKYDSTGYLEWERGYNGPANLEDRANALTVDQFGNIYATGYSFASVSNYDYVTVKIDANGNRLWARRYDGPANGSDAAQAIAVDSAGNVFVTGFSYAEGNSDILTIKYNSDGDTLWIRRYNGPANNADRANAIALDRQGNVYVTGYDYGVGSSSDYCTIKYNSNGDVVWISRYNGPGNRGDNASAIVVDDSNNVYVTGTSGDASNYGDFATLKYNSSGVEQWVQRFTGPGNNNDAANAIALDDARNVYVTGYALHSSSNFKDYTTIKYNPAGVEQWVQIYNGLANNEDWATSMVVDTQGNVYVTGYSIGSNTGNDYATIKYRQHVFVIVNCPNGGECYAGNTNQQIKWRGLITSNIRYRILFSSDGGINYPDTITQNVALTETTYNWLTPNINTTTARILIQMLNNNESIIAQDTCNSNFIIDIDSPTIPNLISPSNDTILNDSCVTFIWHRSTDTISGIRNYRIQIANNANFTNPIDTLIIDTIITRKLNDTVYYWRVKAIDHVYHESNWSQIRNFVVSTLGIEDNTHLLGIKSFAFTIHPNPASSFITICGPLIMDNFTLTLYDVTGKVIKEEKLKDLKERKVSLNGIKNGVYFIRVGSKMLKEKLVVTR